MKKNRKKKRQKKKKKKKKKKRKNIIIIYFINDKKEETNERSVMSWSERADKKDKRKQPRCVKRVGTAVCTARTKNVQIHYPVVLLDTKYVRDSFDLSHRYHNTCIRITQQ